MVLRQSLTCVIAALLATTVLDGQATGSRQAQIQSRLEERVAAGNAVGLVAASLEPDGTVVIAAAGKPGPDALPLDGDSVFEIGSITKVFTSVLLADMVERGEVTLDTPVQKLLPAAVRMPRRNGREITLIDLATHSSGLPRLPNNMAPSNPLDPYSDYGAERLYAFLNSYELTRDIGATFEYSNLGAGLLGHALERRAGKPYKTLVTERILRPLGMTRTSFTPDDWMKAHLALDRQRHDALRARQSRRAERPARPRAGAHLRAAARRRTAGPIDRPRLDHPPRRRSRRAVAQRRHRRLSSLVRPRLSRQARRGGPGELSARAGRSRQRAADHFLSFATFASALSRIRCLKSSGVVLSLARA
jgi:CubicO group peptidase (beta-lactamase class C family)